MRNITFAIEDETYIRAEKEAQRMHTSVPDLARSALVSAATGLTSPVDPEEFLRLENLQRDVQSRISNFSGSDRLPREELYDRKLL